jgi:putative NADPH-quinone reductase/1,4-dihydroxy-2-naphthoate octaprenyltransferase
VLVIDGHPREESLGSALGETVHRAAASRAEECRIIRLRDLDFDPRAHGRALDEDLLEAQRDIEWAEILVMVYPTWWGGVPALLKGFLDRVLHPDFAFAERTDGGWKGLLNGRAALLVTTMDTPRWIYRWLLGAPGHRAMRDATLGFCGIAPIRILSFGPVRTSTVAERRRWLARVAQEGRRLEETFRTGWRVKLRPWIAVSRLHFYVQPWLAYTLGALAVTNGSRAAWHWPGYLLGYAGILLIEFITVATNELADLASDRKNENASALTGGSRVLVDGRLSPEELRPGRRLACAILSAVLLSGLLVIPHAWPMLLVAAVGLALGVAYSAPPIRLSARGVGELNVAVTHSFLVVLAGFVSQAGSLLSATPWLVALPLGLAVLPSITLAGFPDLEADQATGKRTLAVRWGRQRAAIFAGTAAVCAAFLPLCIAGQARPWLWWAALPAIPHAIWLVVRLRRYAQAGSPPGRIDAFLVVALTFMLWICLVPLGVLLFGARQSEAFGVCFSRQHFSFSVFMG